MRPSLRIKLFAAFGVVIALLCVATGLAITKAGDLNENARMAYVEDALPLKTLALDLVTQMVNEETGVRGYLVTGDERSLEP